jgi:glycosyltransferase involved in cell wall biosynthesis
VRWLVFGRGSDRAPFDAERPGVRTLGEVPTAELARTVRALDLLVAPYVDGLTMRRSSAMAALACGVPVVSSTGHLFDFRLAEFAACEPDAGAFASRVALLARDPDARAAAARRAAEAGRVSSPATLATAILEVLVAPRAAA